MSKDVRPPARERAGKSPEAFRTISEVSDELEVPQHVLRFWETKFSQIRPLKRGGGRRYYRPEDIELLRTVRDLLYDDGYTIKGVQKILRSGGGKQGAAAAVRGEKGQGARPARGASAAQGAGKAQPEGAGGLSAEQRRALKEAIDELTALRDLLRRGPGAG